MVFFEEWIYMKSTAIWQYFQYICKKVPFWQVSCIEVGGSLGGYTCQVLLDGVVPVFRKYVFHAGRDIQFALASLGNDDGAYGAFKLALDAFA